MKLILPFVALAALNLLLGPAAYAQSSDSSALFDKHCGLCHREGGPGTYMLERRLGEAQSMLEQRNNLGGDYIRSVVRWGVGSMPRFSRAEITDKELAAIAQHLVPSEKQGVEDE